MTSFIRDDDLPSYFANALGKALSLLCDGLLLARKDNTHLQIVASADEDAAVISVKGLWRYIEATISAAHPGGAAGTYDVYVTATANDIVSSPAPYTDATDYTYALKILASGTTPTIVAGVVDVYREIGHCGWDGAKILWVQQTVPVVGPQPGMEMVGDLILSAAAARPGCLLCDGSAISRTGIYSALFAAIGTAYGVGDGATTFNLPDFRGRTLVGAGAGGGLSARALGAEGGEETHELSVGEMPDHIHGVEEGIGFIVQDNAGPAGIQHGADYIFNTEVGTADTGGGGAHNNMQPFTVANVFIVTG